MVRKTLKTGRKKKNTYNKSKVYKSKAKKSQKRGKKHNKKSQRRKMKGGHAYTRRLLEMTSRAPKKEGFTPAETDISKKNNFTKNIEKKIIKEQTEDIPEISKKINSELNAINYNQDRIEQENEFIENLKANAIQKSTRRQRKFGKKEGEKAIKDIQKYAKKLDEEGLSDEEYNAKLKKYSDEKMNDIVNRFQSEDVKKKLNKLRNVNQSIQNINNDAIEESINKTGELINQKIIEKVEEYQKELDNNAELTDDEKFIALQKEGQNVAKSVGEKMHALLQNIPNEERKQYMISPEFQQAIKNL